MGGGECQALRRSAGSETPRGGSPRGSKDRLRSPVRGSSHAAAVAAGFSPGPGGGDSGGGAGSVLDRRSPRTAIRPGYRHAGQTGSALGFARRIARGICVGCGGIWRIPDLRQACPRRIRNGPNIGFGTGPKPRVVSGRPVYRVPADTSGSEPGGHADSRRRRYGARGDHRRDKCGGDFLDTGFSASGGPRRRGQRFAGVVSGFGGYGRAAEVDTQQQLLSSSGVLRWENAGVRDGSAGREIQRHLHAGAGTGLPACRSGQGAPGHDQRDICLAFMECGRPVRPLYKGVGWEAGSFPGPGWRGADSDGG